DKVSQQPQFHINNFCFPNSKYKIEKIFISNLENNSSYKLEVFDKNNQLIDLRFFKTLNTLSNSLKIGLMSCMDDRSPIHAPMWKSVIEKKSDILFFLGDNAYIDDEEISTTPESIWERHVETRMTLDIYQVENLIPILAIWDDHDYGVDNGNSSFEHKQKSLEIFKAFFGNNDSTYLENGPGNCFYVRLANQRFVFFDSRYFRQNESLSTSKVWGQDQISWFISKLDPKSNDPVWFVNGSQFFGAYHHYESVEREASTELTQLLDVARNLNSVSIFISGDLHYSEISSIEKKLLGFQSLELTSSAIHSTKADDLRNNPRRVISYRENNYFIVTAHVNQAQLNLKIDICGRNQTYNSSSYNIKK
ncbi:MAG: alkaline phosphatase D family protein, partial [Bdellovibrionaceae bacterium]|nr:alkaline phosphatase D family protein [Pseudobdellovibrionaceae bacterium]